MQNQWHLKLNVKYAAHGLITEGKKGNDVLGIYSPFLITDLH